jgi:transcriptional regulator with GAF, ATPase, and Fis domain
VGTLGEQRLQRLIEAGRALVSELHPEVLLERLLEVAAEMTDAEYVALGILDPTKTNLENFITHGVDPETQRRIGDLPRGRGVLGLLITDPNPIRLSNVNAHPESYGFPPGHPVMRTFLGVPVRIRGEVYGNLYLTEKAGGRDFTEEDEASIVILADWAAIAIANARLYHAAEQRRLDLERAVRGLEVTTAIARAVGGETDIDRVLELIVKRARALVHARGLTIMLLEGDELVVAATAGDLDESLRGRRVPAKGTVADAVMHSGRPERAGDREPGHRARERTGRAARLSLAHARRAHRDRPPRRRAAVRPRGRRSAPVVRGKRGHRGPHRALRRRGAPAARHRRLRAGAPALGARTARRNASGTRQPAAAGVLGVAPEGPGQTRRSCALHARPHRP